MSSLYRCRARVGYRLYKSERMIVFDEKQIQELNIKLKWEPGLGSSNADRSTEASVITNTLNQSTCSITVSDPYLSGLAWPVLYDGASLYSQNTVYAANNLLLPPCQDGQDPYKDKCAQYIDVEAENNQGLSSSDFAYIYIGLWYDVKGTSFGSDFYFRVNGFSVSHGARYPSVTIRGSDARTILFNQSLINLTLNAGTDIDEAIKGLVEKLGYVPTFCANPNEDLSRKRIIPDTVRYKGITPDEAIKKLLNSTGGNMLHLPTMEFANKVSICSRAEIEQGCSVFYLGKGLYEGYEISGQPELGIVPRNLESGSNANEADPYSTASFDGATYLIGNMVPETRKKAMEKVKKVAFPGLFGKVGEQIKAPWATAGYVWRDQKPVSANSKGIVVINEQATQVEKLGLNLFGIAPNGTTAISYLSGEVEEADKDSGRVLIKTDFSLQICEKEGSKKCFFRPVFQESVNLSDVKVKTRDKVEISAEIGSSTAEKKEFIRLYILGHNQKRVVLNPQIVWDWAFPKTSIPKTQVPAVSSGTDPKIANAGPKANNKNWKATSNEKPSKILMMAGHADLRSSGAETKPYAKREVDLTIDLVRWAQRNAQQYGISDFVEFYFPPSGNIEDYENPASQFSQTKNATSAGKQVLEIHLDAGDGTGSSGVIPPATGQKIRPLDDSLASVYGAFPRDHRDDLGVPRRGGTIVEVGSYNPSVAGIYNNGTAAQKEALYRQLMGPLMRSIAVEKARTGAPSAQQTTGTSQTSTPGQKICVKMGSSGISTGPHLHAEWGTGFDGGNSRPITAEQVRKYVDVEGSISSGYGPRKSGMHKGVDIANSLGTPICLKEGISVKEVGETNCPDNGNGCGAGGYGNVIIINTPEGPMLLGHLAQKGIPSNITGLTASSGAGKTQNAIQSSPSIQGLTIETSFKGVPRALRIIPGRTILSFISDYDAWLDNNRSPSIDPGVWIPQRFKNWFVKECQYRWREGDLRVEIEGISAWGTTSIGAPSFNEYLAGMKKSGDLKNAKNYYDYIRSIGDLNWKLDDGKDSTSVRCKDAQNLTEFLNQGDNTGTGDSGGSSGPSNVSSNFPAAKCQYTGNRYPQDRVNAIINAAYSAGIKNKAAFAGIVGNAIHESRDNGIELNPRANNGNRNYRFDGCVGIFQWCDRRAGLQKFVQSRGKPISAEYDFGEQMAFFKAELTPGSGYQDTTANRNGNIITRLNATTDPAIAADIFLKDFERADTQGRSERIAHAKEIFNNLTCS